MARRRRRSDRDDAIDISSLPLRSSILRSIAPALRALEDRRLFTPEIYPPARAFRRSATQLREKHVTRNVNRTSKVVRSYKLPLDAGVRFSDPSRVGICIRRHQRREVLFANLRAGRGKRNKVGRWSEFSDVKCR